MPRRRHRRSADQKLLSQRSGPQHHSLRVSLVSAICKNKMSKFGNTGCHCHFWFELRSANIYRYQTIDMADLSSKDVERAEFAFSIYDDDGTNVIDAVNLGDVLRALNLNPTNATIEKLGGTKKKGEKKMKLDEFLPIFSQCKKDKEQGCYEDFLECLKLYDKQENGMMLSAELSHTLLSLGERLTDAECETVLKDCMDPEDDDGFIPYAPFLKKMMVLLPKQ